MLRLNRMASNVINSTFSLKNALKSLVYLRFNNKNTPQSGKIEVCKTP